MIAVYVNSNQFTVSGDKTEEFTSKRRLKIDCGIDGIRYSSVLSSSYSSPNTTVIISENDLTSNLIDVLYGIVQSGNIGSLPEHDHSDLEGQGGTVELLDLIDTPNSYSNGKVLMSTASGTVWATDFQSFIDLDDTPTTYSGSVGKYLRVTASGVEFIEIPSGTKGLQSIKVVYKDADEIYLNPGVVEINGQYYKIDNRLEKQLTSLPVSQWCYIYIKPPTSGIDITTSQVEWTTSAPVRDLTKRGRYHSTNTSWRCVGVIWSSTNFVAEFSHEGNYYQGISYTDVSWATPSNVWTSYTAGACAFGDTIATFHLILDYVNLSGAWLYGRSAALSSTLVPTIAYVTTTNDGNALSVKMAVNSSRQYSIKWNAATTNRVHITSIGFMVPDDIYNGPSGLSSITQKFIDLTDTPTTYVGSVGKYLRTTASGIEFVDIPTYSNVQTLLDLTDTPSSYSDGKYLMSTASGTIWATVSGGGTSNVQSFLDLNDTPVTYAGSVGKYLRTTASGVEFVDIPTYSNVQTLLDLTDTPTTYSGSVGKYLRTTASGVEFVDIPTYSNVQTLLDLTDTPTTYSGSVGKYLRTTASGVEFTNEIVGASLYIDGDATVTGTIRASTYDSLSPLILKSGGKTIMEADDITGIADFKYDVTVSGVSIFGTNGGPAPVGSVIWHASNTPPSGYLICDGSAISRSIYSDLYGVIGTLYGVGNNSTTFNLPDLRSEFIRGAGLGRGLDGDHNVGTTQSGTEHLALSTNATPTRVYIGYASYFDIANSGGEEITTGSLTGSINFDATTNTYLSKTYKSIPRNIALLPCIRYSPRTFSDGGISPFEYKNSMFTAVAGGRYQDDTYTVGTHTMNLPTNPTSMDEVVVEDAKGYWGTNSLIIDPGTKNIRGLNDTLEMDMNWAKITLVYIDNTTGWRY